MFLAKRTKLHLTCLSPLALVADVGLLLMPIPTELGKVALSNIKCGTIKQETLALSA